MPQFYGAHDIRAARAEDRQRTAAVQRHAEIDAATGNSPGFAPFGTFAESSGVRHYGSMQEFAISGASDIFAHGAYLAKFAMVAIAMKLHAVIAQATPVDTGYLRLSLRAAVGDESPPLPPERASDAKTGQYVPDVAAGDAASIASIGRFGLDEPVLTLGFTANYAPYVEPHAHMIDHGVLALPSIIAETAASLSRGAKS